MTNCSFALAKSTATFGAATGSFEVAITVGPFNREPMGNDVRAFKSNFGETVFRDLHRRTRQLHLRTQLLHLGHGEAGIVGDDCHAGGLEKTVQRLQPRPFLPLFPQQALSGWRPLP